MKKRLLLSLLGLAVLIAVLGIVKFLQIRAMTDHAKKFVPPAETVTSVPVKADRWATSLTAVGTLNAVQGVTVTAELPGKVVDIAFEAGMTVQKGDILLRQDTSSEDAQLPGAVAQADLARTNLARSDQLLEKGIIAKVDRDNAVTALAQAESQADNIRAAIKKKTIRAPFSGKLGIRQVNLGQTLKEGDPIVVLQTFDPIFADFSLPERHVPSLRTGLPVRVTGDALPGVEVTGTITTVSPQVEAETRNIKAQATVANRSGMLRSGMFVNVAVELPGQRSVLVIPTTAVLYAPYSDSVFVIEEQKGSMILRQQFVRLGEKRGDFVEVTEGLKEGEIIVSTGVFKLRNGQAVTVDNTLAPPFEKAPAPENS
jgi:membrane fusion protein (multidrug efflux system)